MPEGTTVKGLKYSSQLSRVEAGRAAYGPWHGKSTSNTTTPHHTPPDAVKAKLKRLDWELLPHSPYSPDLAPSLSLVSVIVQRFAGQEIQRRDGAENVYSELF